LNQIFAENRIFIVKSHENLERRGLFCYFILP